MIDEKIDYVSEQACLERGRKEFEIAYMDSKAARILSLDVITDNN